MKPPILPTPSSWFPGHMSAFMKNLPTLLSRTDIILELRDSRLPLTSINPIFEFHLKQWKGKQKASPEDPFVGPQRIIVLSKRDLVPLWGIEPYIKSMKIHTTDALIQFVSSQDRGSIKELYQHLVSLAKLKPPDSETNVLVVGMPNVGKSTILNSLRSLGIRGKTAKAMQTSAHPGKTRTLSTRLKLSENPRVYAYDTPGVMVPFLGKGEYGAERGIKLALIAGIKETMYDIEFLAAYLLYRLYKLDPNSPPYMTLLPSGTHPDLEVDIFLDLLATRLGMLLSGAERDKVRAATWFVRWWREKGGKDTAKMKFPETNISAGWGFDFDWTVDPEGHDTPQNASDLSLEAMMQSRMVQFAEQLKAEQASGAMVSATQEKRRLKEEQASRKRANRALTNG